MFNMKIQNDALGYLWLPPGTTFNKVSMAIKWFLILIACNEKIFLSNGLMSFYL